MKKLIFPLSIAVLWSMAFVQTMGWAGVGVGLALGAAFGLLGSEEEEHHE